MVKPISQSEPTHPQARAEAEQRVSLVQAIEEEIESLKKLEERQTNQLWKDIVAVQRMSLQRILKRWVRDAD